MKRCDIERRLAASTDEGAGRDAVVSANGAPMTAEPGGLDAREGLLPRLIRGLHRSRHVGRVARWPSVLAIALTLMAGAVVPLAGCANDTSAAPAGKVAAETIPYRIGPGDSLSVFVYGVPSLSVKAVPVRPDGRFSMPLIPNIEAAGKTTTELDKELTKRLSKYVKAPIVTVMVDSFHGAMGTAIHVLSGTSPPKEVPYVDHMTLLDVMTQVGGLPRFGAPNDAYVIRREKNGQEKKIPVHIGALINRGALSQNITMRPGDVVVIPQSLF